MEYLGQLQLLKCWAFDVYQCFHISLSDGVLFRYGTTHLVPIPFYLGRFVWTRRVWKYTRSAESWKLKRRHETVWRGWKGMRERKTDLLIYQMSVLSWWGLGMAWLPNLWLWLRGLWKKCFDFTCILGEWEFVDKPRSTLNFGFLWWLPGSVVTTALKFLLGEVSSLRSPVLQYTAARVIASNWCPHHGKI